MDTSTLKNLYLRTNVEIHLATGGQVKIAPGRIVLRCTHLPEDLERNQIIYPSVPSSWDEVRSHVAAAGLGALSFSSPGGSRRRLSTFTMHGHHVRQLSVLQWQGQSKKEPSAKLTVLRTDNDWQAAIRLRHSQHIPGLDRTQYFDFTKRRMAMYRHACNAGIGRWFGLMVNHRLVSTCGVMCPHGALARFRLVLTHPSYRRRGYAAQLVRSAAQYVMSECTASAVLITALSGSSAERIYESAGFQPIQSAFQIS